MTPEEIEKRDKAADEAIAEVADHYNKEIEMLSDKIEFLTKARDKIIQSLQYCKERLK